ncbi:hypothetical protein L208DRAFT_1438542 [Tricholoma matsutake]|nr:hypothetical protein L208DRAFT_1438542 [Tricholoma matsutake 945]
MVPTRTFCCCIPVRAGVIIIAIIGILGGGALSVLGGLQAERMTGKKVAIAISITVYALLAILSVLGFIGAIARRLHLIKIYFGMLLAHLIFSMGMGGFAIFRVFRESSLYFQDCLQSQAATLSDNPTKICKDGVKIIKGVIIALFVVLWLFEIWGCVIVSNYSKQLAAEKSVHGVVKDTEAW